MLGQQQGLLLSVLGSGTPGLAEDMMGIGGREGNCWAAPGIESREQDGPPSSLGAEMALGAGSHPAWCREECWDHTFPDGIWSLGLLETDSQVPQESEEGVLGSLRLPMAPHSARWMPEYPSQ